MFVKIGNHNSGLFIILTNKGCRTQAQFDAAMDIIKDDNFLFLTGNPFFQAKPDERYKCTFRFMYFTRDGKMRSVNITPTGKLKGAWSSDDQPFIREVPLIEEKIKQLKSKQSVKTKQDIVAELDDLLSSLKSKFPVGSVINHPRGKLEVTDIEKFNVVLPIDGLPLSTSLPVGVCYNRFYLYFGSNSTDWNLNKIFID